MTALEADKRLASLIGEKYRVERRLAAGAMGVVYAGTNTWTGRSVALKFPRVARGAGGTDGAPQIERFMREARAASRIDHPNAVAVLDLGRDARGDVFLVQELLEGETLAELLARGPLELVRARALLLPAMEALQVAHDRGVIHRDIKPENLFVTRRDGAETLKVLDFGVAHLTDVSPDDRLTLDGACVGTPAFMSPEQCRGAQVDGRADIWAVALVWCEALSGTRVFAAASANETLARVLTEAVVVRLPPASASVTAALQRALAPDPAARWASMTEFAAALRGAEPGRPVTRPPLQGRGGFLGALVAVIVLLAAFAASRRDAPRGALPLAAPRPAQGSVRVEPLRVPPIPPDSGPSSVVAQDRARQRPRPRGGRRPVDASSPALRVNQSPILEL